MIFWEQAVRPDLFPSLSLSECPLGSWSETGPVKCDCLCPPGAGLFASSADGVWGAEDWKALLFPWIPGHCAHRSSSLGGTLGMLPRAAGRGTCDGSAWAQSGLTDTAGGVGTRSPLGYSHRLGQSGSLWTFHRTIHRIPPGTQWPQFRTWWNWSKVEGFIH